MTLKEFIEPFWETLAVIGIELPNGDTREVYAGMTREAPICIADCEVIEATVYDGYPQEQAKLKSNTFGEFLNERAYATYIEPHLVILVASDEDFWS